MITWLLERGYQVTGKFKSSGLSQGASSCQTKGYSASACDGYTRGLVMYAAAFAHCWPTVTLRSSWASVTLGLFGPNLGSWKGWFGRRCFFAAQPMPTHESQALCSARLCSPVLLFVTNSITSF
jgi:hypothetical protein